MRKKSDYLLLLPYYLLLLAACVLIIYLGSKAVTVLADKTENSRCIIIDAGHGGIDGGATSCTGVLESSVNLQIALKLNDLMHLLGMETKMIRTTDTSVYTQGTTIASQKVSDLKERVRIVNSQKNAVLVSIHQNYYPESQYSGAQVFYAGTDGSAELAKQIQELFVSTLNPGSRRKSKRSVGVYLMEHIQCTGVLIECGFLSNPKENALLSSEDYQRKLCCVIASACSRFAGGRMA